MVHPGLHGRARIPAARWPASGGWVVRLGVVWLASVFVGCAAGQSVRPPAAQERGPSARPSQAPQAELVPEAYTYFTTGNLYAATGQDSAAIASFRRALTFDPGSRQIRMALAEAYARAARYDEAAITAESIIPRDPPLMQFLADIYSRMRHFQRRLAIFEEWSGLDSTNADVWRFLANAYRAKSDTAQLLRAMDALATLQPDPVVYEQLGFLQLERGQPDDAERSFQRAVAMDSTQKATRVLLGLAQIWSDRGRPDSAYLYYRGAIERNPENVDLIKRYIFFLMQNQRSDEARQQSLRLLELAPGEPDVLYRLAILEYEAERLDSAEMHLTRLIADFGDDAMARYLLGRIALELGDSVKAEAQYQQSLAVADTLVEPYLSLAFLYNQWKQYDLAVELYQKGLTALPDQENLLFGLGASLERAGRFDLAVETFERLLSRRPDFAPGLNYLGYMLADAGVRLGEARKLIEHALKLEPENGAYLDSHAWVLFKLGKTREAAEVMRRALEQLQSDGVVFEHYGDILAAMGKNAEALENWRKALELDPDNDALKEKLKR